MIQCNEWVQWESRCVFHSGHDVQKQCVQVTQRGTFHWGRKGMGFRCDFKLRQCEWTARFINHCHGFAREKQDCNRERLHSFCRRIILLNFAGFNFEWGIGSGEASSMVRYSGWPDLYLIPVLFTVQIRWRYIWDFCKRSLAICASVKLSLSLYAKLLGVWCGDSLGSAS